MMSRSVPTGSRDKDFSGLTQKINGQDGCTQMSGSSSLVQPPTKSQSIRTLRRAATEPGQDLQNILSYVPRMAVQQYLDDPSLETAEGAKPESFPAAVLFADISGMSCLGR